MDPIAIVGFSFKGPQEALGEEKLWDVLQTRKNLMTEWPADRSTVDAFHDRGSGKAHTLIGRGGHFMKEDPAGFDAPFFTIMPKEACAMDPQQRWLLETSYHAFENAGMTVDRLKNSRTAVFEASMSDDYAKMQSKDPDRTPVSASTGNANSIRANRVSWHFGLLGPSIHVDTACSSSLIAMDLACQSIYSGDADAALVLGCNLILGPEISLGLGNQGFLSPSSLCYSFDHRANGYSRGEGFVAIVIKPLSRSIADGNMIRAVIRATGANSDGHTPTMTQPSVEAQENLIRHVYGKAGLGFESTRYFEAHGTGTPTGDPIEMKAIGRVFRKSRSVNEPLYVGSIKANLGHLEGAAGLAGIVKSILILEKGIIPPNALFEKMNPDIDAEFYNVQVPTQLIDWPSSGIRRISVNSFGMGGANAHIILDDALSFLNTNRLRGNHQCTSTSHMPSAIPETLHISSDVSQNSCTPHFPTNERHITDVPIENQLNDAEIQNPALRLLVWTANDENAISRVSKNVKQYYETKDWRTVDEVDRLAFTLSARRTHLPWRAFSVVDARATKRAFIYSSKPMRASRTQDGIAFVFTGQGSQYVNMGSGLMQYPVVRATLKSIDDVFRELGSEWSLFDAIKDGDCINQPEYTQPLCTALQIALVELLKQFGISPVAVVGHSSGEIAAAYTVGALSMASAASVAYFRGRSAGRLRALVGSSSPMYAMMSVNLSQEQADNYLKMACSIGDKGPIISQGAVHIACINSPVNVTLSGTEDAINALKRHLDDEGVFAQKINTGGIAYHSPIMETISEEYLKSLQFLNSSSPVKKGRHHMAMASSVSGIPVAIAELAKPQYWVDNLVSPVKFFQAFCSLISDGDNVNNKHPPNTNPMGISQVIEVGPHAALRRPILDILKNRGIPHNSEIGNYSKNTIQYHSILLRNKSSLQTALELSGQLFCNGYPVSILFANQHEDYSLGTPTILVDLPEYPFNHAVKYWEESRLSVQHRLRRAPKPTPDGSTALLGQPVADWNPHEPRWRNFLSIEALPWIGDHIINGTHLLAGTCMIAMAIEAVKQKFEDNGNAEQQISAFFIKNAHFIRPIIVSQAIQDATETILQLRPLHRNELEKGSTQNEVLIWTCSIDKKWKECFRCSIQLDLKEAAPSEVDAGVERRLEQERLRNLYYEAQTRCVHPVPSNRFYEFLRVRADVNYRGAFSLLENMMWDKKCSSVARINLLANGKSPEPYPLHPRGALFDAAAHLSVLATSKGLTDTAHTMVLSRLSGFWVSSRLFEKPPMRKDLQSTAKILTVSSAPGGLSRGVKCSVLGLSDVGDVLFSIKQVEMASVSQETGKNFLPGSHNHEKMIYGLDWQPQLSLMSPKMLQAYLDKIPIDQEKEDFMINYYPKIEFAMISVARRTLKDFSISQSRAPGVLQYLDKLESALAHFYGDDGQQSQASMADDELEALLQDCERQKPSWRIFCVVARNLKRILRGELDPLLLFFSADLADDFYKSLFDTTFIPQFNSLLELICHQKPGLNVLEVGAGTGGFTRQIISAFSELETRKGIMSFSQYTYTDISPAFFENGREISKSFDGRFNFKCLDLEQKSHEEEGFELESYDIIFAGSVLHATKDLTETLKGLRRLLKRNGYLVFLEITAPQSACGNVGFGVLPGWWLSTEQWRQHSPLINEEQWDKLLKETGFSGTNAVLRDFRSDVCHFSSIIVSQNIIQGKIGNEEPATQAIPRQLNLLPTSFNHPPNKTRYILIIDEKSELQRDVSASLCKRSGWVTSGIQVLSWHKEAEKGDDNEILAAAADINTVLISLLEISAPFLARMSKTSFIAIQKITSRLRNMLWVTNTSIDDPEFPFYSAMKGFLRVVRAEGIERFIVTLEVESLPSKRPMKTSEILTDYITTVVRTSFTSTPAELEYIARGGFLGTWKLIEEVKLNTRVYRQIHSVLQSGQWLPGPALELSVGTPGMLDSFRFEEDTICNQQVPLGPEDVEIEGKAWPLSFRDLLVALGRLEYNTPGLECAGTVTRVGTAVAQGKSYGSPITPLQPGDRVLMAMGDLGTMRTYPRGKGMAVQRLPDGVSFEAAASALNPAMTAYHGIINMARIQKGETILIHSAAGATGQMAIMIAQMVGAEVYATVGHDAKKKFLMDEFGIPANHIFYSRDTSFAQGIKRTTGRGVDVVLNSLSGEALRASWACVAPYGRFVEIGKADIISNAQLPMEQFAGNTSFFAVDLFHMCLHNTILYQDVLQNVLKLIDQGLIKHPRPLHCYPLSDIEAAFRFMQSGKNTGRIVLTADRQDIIPKFIRSPDKSRLRDDASYLIIGGLGGIGRAIMTWMADKGAKNLITLSRSGLAPSAEAAHRVVAELKQRGVRIHTIKCDASSSASMESALKECAESMPPIIGAINASMDIYDTPLESMIYVQWVRGLESKISTSFNMHQHLPVGSLDFFILLSSLAGIYGTIAQSNYAAGCTFQDAIARYRAEQGENAVSVDIGWMRSVGKIAETEEYQRNRENQRDMLQVETEELLSLLSVYCQPKNGQKPQVLLGAITPAYFLDRGETPAPLLQRPMFTSFAQMLESDKPKSASNANDPARLFQQAATAEEQAQVVVHAVMARLGRALGVSADDIEPTKQLSDYGVDSLMAVELRNWIGKEFKANVAVFDLTGGASIIALGELVAERTEI